MPMGAYCGVPLLFTLFFGGGRMFKAAVFSILGWASMASTTLAATFDVSDDFSSTSNPAGPWSYGSYSTIDDTTTFAAFST